MIRSALKKGGFFIYFFLALFAFMCFSCKSLLKKTEISIKTHDGILVPIKVELAQTEEQRMHGYMGRKIIPEGTGMLFVFESDQILSFWMKNTPHPLSIAYITSDGRIKDIFDMKPFSLESIVSTGYVRYALEVPQGWFVRNSIDCGDFLQLK